MNISMRRGNEALNMLHCHGDTFAHKVRHFPAVCRVPSIMDTGIIVPRDLLMRDGLFRAARE